MQNTRRPHIIPMRRFYLALTVVLIVTAPAGCGESGQGDHADSDDEQAGALVGSMTRIDLSEITLSEKSKSPGLKAISSLTDAGNVIANRIRYSVLHPAEGWQLYQIQGLDKRQMIYWTSQGEPIMVHRFLDARESRSMGAVALIPSETSTIDRVWVSYLGKHERGSDDSPLAQDEIEEAVRGAVSREHSIDSAYYVLSWICHLSGDKQAAYLDWIRDLALQRHALVEMSGTKMGARADGRTTWFDRSVEPKRTQTYPDLAAMAAAHLYRLSGGEESEALRQTMSDLDTFRVALEVLSGDRHTTVGTRGAWMPLQKHYEIKPDMLPIMLAELNIRKIVSGHHFNRLFNNSQGTTCHYLLALMRNGMDSEPRTKASSQAYEAREKWSYIVEKVHRDEGLDIDDWLKRRGFTQEQAAGAVLLVERFDAR